MAFRDDGVTRLPGGITNVSTEDLFNSLREPDRTLYHVDFDDFDTFLTGAYTVTETQAGATQALTAGDGGLLLLTNSAADNDINQIQRPVGNFLPVSGKKLFFKARFQLSDVVDSDFAIGLQLVNADGTTLATATDGIFFLKADDAATLTLYVRKDNTTGSTNSGAIVSLVNATFIDVAFFYDGLTTVFYQANGTKGAILLSSAAAFLPDTPVCLIASLKNGAAAAKTATVDRMFVAQER